MLSRVNFGQPVQTRSPNRVGCPAEPAVDSNQPHRQPTLCCRRGWATRKFSTIRRFSQSFTPALHEHGLDGECISHVQGDRAAAQQHRHHATIQDGIDLDTLGALAVLDRQGWRYTTVESWSRKVVKYIHGSQPLFGLEPVAAAMELLVNAPAYSEEPILYIKDRGILQDITKHPIEVPDGERDRMFRTKRVSYAFLTSRIASSE